MPKHSRSKPFAVRMKMKIHGKTFMVAATFNNYSKLFKVKTCTYIHS